MRARGGVATHLAVVDVGREIEGERARELLRARTRVGSRDAALRERGTHARAHTHNLRRALLGLDLLRHIEAQEAQVRHEVGIDALLLAVVAVDVGLALRRDGADLDNDPVVVLPARARVSAHGVLQLRSDVPRVRQRVVVAAAAVVLAA
jgi:hypothetical protein